MVAGHASTVCILSLQVRYSSVILCSIAILVHEFTMYMNLLTSEAVS